MNWKKGLIFGSIAAGTVLFLTGRRPAGLIVAGIGLVTLAADNPEKFEEVWRRMPEYIDRGSRLLDRAAGFVELVGQRGSASLRDIASR